MFVKTLLTSAYFASMSLALPKMPMSRNPLHQRAAVLYNPGANQLGTYYYENAHDGDACAADGSQAPSWSSNQIKGVPMCEYHVSSGPKTLEELNTNRVVAISNIRLQAGFDGRDSDLCGKQVNVYIDGKQFSFSEGPFVLWDGCERCNGESGIDFSGQAYAEMFGDCRSGLSVNTPHKLTFEVVDVDLMTRDSNGEWTGSPTYATYSGSGNPPQDPPPKDDPPTPPPSDNTCSWKDHCLGASCSSSDDCSDDLVCTNKKCAKP